MVNLTHRISQNLTALHYNGAWQSYSLKQYREEGPEPFKFYSYLEVESPNKGHFGTNINSSGLSLYRDCPLLRDSNCIILIGRLKFGDLVLSIVEKYLIQCPLFGVSVKRDSTVYLRSLHNP